MILLLKHFIASKRLVIVINLLLVLAVAILMLWPSTRAEAHLERGSMLHHASENVNVSVTVLPHLTLSIVDGQPVVTTNHPRGGTLHIDDSKKPYIFWTLTTDF